MKWSALHEACIAERRLLDAEHFLKVRSRKAYLKSTATGWRVHLLKELAKHDVYNFLYNNGFLANTGDGLQKKTKLF